MDITNTRKARRRRASRWERWPKPAIATMTMCAA